MVKPAGETKKKEKKETTKRKKEGAKTKGKQRITIAYIEDKEKRQVTFSKRKGGLLKKASELHLLTAAHVAVVIFSQKQPPQQPAAAEAPRSSSSSSRRRPRGGNVFAMGAPSVDHVIGRHLVAGGGDGGGGGGHAGGGGQAEAEEKARRTEEARAMVEADKERMKEVAAKVRMATAAGRFWWEADVAALGEPELPEFGAALKRLRDNVRRHADRLVPQ